MYEVGAAGPAAADRSRQTVVALRRLQTIADYRGALQNWFRTVAVGGHLLIVVPHAFLDDRQLELPSRRDPARRRLYTPASLLGEIEEALAPNSYRVRYAGDADAGYDYLGRGEERSGESDVAVAIERIALPDWSLDVPRDVKAARPDFGFEPSRTRIEARSFPVRHKILLLKLDHMGDFIMDIPVLERARTLFADAEITLVVGPWNAQVARDLGVADHVIPFAAFPRNSSEEEVDVHGKAALFQATVTDEYDLAIDLRTDVDTRILLRRAKARLRAGIGTAAQFPFLDIFLPLDFNRNRPETARETRYEHHRFHTQHHVERGDYRLVSDGERAERHCGILWGPYDRLRPGRYVFEPHLELAPAQGGMLMLDVAVDARRAGYVLLPSAQAPIRLPFAVERPDAEFEFRIWTVEDMPAIGFSFYGGRLLREGAGSTLHQSEYGALLIELVAMRLARTGFLAELGTA